MLFADYQGTRLTEGIDTGEIAVPSTPSAAATSARIPLTGSVNGNAWAAHAFQRAWAAPVTAGEPYSAGLSRRSDSRNPLVRAGKISAGIDSAAQRRSARSLPPPPRPRPCSDDKGALRAGLDPRQGNADRLLLPRQLLARQSLSHRHRRSQRARLRRHLQRPAQLASLGHTITFGSAALNEFHLSYMRNANAVGQPKGGVGPSLAAQGFSTDIVAAQALHRRHRERRLQRLHPGRGHHRAGAGREHLRGQRRLLAASSASMDSRPAARSTPTRSTPTPT